MMFTCRTGTCSRWGEDGPGQCLRARRRVHRAHFSELAAQILANSWYSHRANKRLVRYTDGLLLEAGLAHEVYYGEGRGPDMHERIAGFSSKTVKQT